MIKLWKSGRGKEMKIKFDDYQIGLLTQLFGVTPDTIRLYTKKGILNPMKKQENNFRIFKRDDVFSMDYIMRLRRMGISLDSIRNIICEDDFADTRRRVSKKIREIESEIEKLQDMQRALCNFERSLEELEQKVGVLQIKEMPAVLLMDIKNSLPETVNFLKSLDQELDPLLTVYIPGNTHIEDNEQSYLNRKNRQEANLVVTCVDVNGISQNKNFPTDKISILNPSKYVCLIGKIETGEKMDAYKLIDDFILKYGLQKKGRILSRFIATQRIYTRPFDYYEIWVPVK